MQGMSVESSVILPMLYLPLLCLACLSLQDRVAGFHSTYQSSNSMAHLEHLPQLLNG